MTLPAEMDIISSFELHLCFLRPSSGLRLNPYKYTVKMTETQVVH